MRFVPFMSQYIFSFYYNFGQKSRLAGERNKNCSECGLIKE